MNIKMGSNAAKVIANVAGDAVELRQAEVDVIRWNERSGFLLECCLEGFNLILI